MYPSRFLQSALILGGFVAGGFGGTIRVAGDQPTVQAGINAASNGDVVLVAPGTYRENINFLGKNITVKSSNGRKVTILDGSQNGSVVTFSSKETRKAVLKGFTITNGYAGPGGFGSGGGILITGGETSPSIIANTITANSSCDPGGGIYLIASAALIKGNTISKNFQKGCFGGEGAGIMVENGEAGLEIIGNKIISNTWDGDGGGMYINAFGSTLIQNNVVANNTATGVFPAAHGGGIYINAGANVSLVRNLVYGNTADQGGGVYLAVQGGTTESLVSNNFANNISSQAGSAIYITGLTSNAQLFDNLLAGRSGENSVFCDTMFTQVPPLFEANDAFSKGG